jgi:hypothetical protein
LSVGGARTRRHEVSPARRSLPSEPLVPRQRGALLMKLASPSQGRTKRETVASTSPTRIRDISASIGGSLRLRRRLPALGRQFIALSPAIRRWTKEHRTPQAAPLLLEASGLQDESTRHARPDTRQHPWQHPHRPMRPYRPDSRTDRTIWRDSDGYDSRVTRLRAWSGITGWRFESSSAHREALHGKAFRVCAAATSGSHSGRGNTFGNIRRATTDEARAAPLLR